MEGGAVKKRIIRSGIAQRSFVKLNSIFQTQVDRISDQCMPYAYFIQPGDMFF